MKIATRSSKLALAQVKLLIDALGEKDLDFEIKTQITEGDKKSARGENLFDKAHFVEDIEDSLLAMEADIAVHSLKDMSSIDREGLEIYAAIPHSSRTDVLIYRDSINLGDLETINIGTSSLRRQRQCKYFLKNTNCAEIRGNIDTRLKKLFKGDFDAIILARAGIERLQFNLDYIELDFLPAIGQGIIAIQCRSNDSETKKVLSQIRDKTLIQSIEIERYLVRALQATCSSALSVQSNIYGSDFDLDLEIYGRENFISKNFTGQLKNQTESLDNFINEIITEGGLEMLNENN